MHREEQGQAVPCWARWWALTVLWTSSHHSKREGCCGEQSKNAAIPCFHIPLGRKCLEELRTISPLAPCQFFILRCVFMHKPETMAGFTMAPAFVKIQQKLFLLWKPLAALAGLCAGRGGELARSMALLGGSAGRWSRAEVSLPLRPKNCNKP